MSKKDKLGIIGFGNMGRAIGEALISKNNWDISVYDKYKKKTKDTKNVTVAKTSEEVISSSKVVILAIKPQDIREFVQKAREYFVNKKPLLITIAAGVSTKSFQNFFKDIRVIRAMPNLAATVGESVSFLCKGKFAKKADLEIAKEIFARVGEVIVADESYLDKVTSVSGSGPGYIFYIMDSMYKGTLKLGFNEGAARKMVVQTFLGAAKLAKESGKDFQCLVKEVASKGGTTEAALKVFNSCQLDKIVEKGINNAYRRAKEISSSYTR